MNGKIRPMHPGVMSHGIIATGPMINTPGYLPRAVVVRALDGANQAADDPTDPVKYVVHTLAIQENGKVSFDQGDYLHVQCAGKTDRDGALSWALAKANRRTCDMLCVTDPLRKAAMDLLTGAFAHYDGGEQHVMVPVDAYKELQHVLARLTGQTYGPEITAEED